MQVCWLRGLPDPHKRKKGHFCVNTSYIYGLKNMNGYFFLSWNSQGFALAAKKYILNILKAFIGNMKLRIILVKPYWFKIIFMQKHNPFLVFFFSPIYMYTVATSLIISWCCGINQYARLFRFHYRHSTVSLPILQLIHYLLFWFRAALQLVLMLTLSSGTLMPPELFLQRLITKL